MSVSKTNNLLDDQFLLGKLMDILPDNIFFKDTESKFIKINKACADKFGLKDPAEAVGKTDFDFFREEDARISFEDEKMIMKTGQPVIGKIESGVSQTGSNCLTWSSTTKMPLLDEDGQVIGTFGIARDITKQKLAEEALRTSEEKYRGIFENIQDVFYRTDNEGLITEITPSIEFYSGFKRSEIIGKNTSLFYKYTEDKSKLVEKLKNYGVVSDFEIRLRTKSGKLVYASANARLMLNDNDEIIGTEGTLRDITGRKKAEYELKETHHFFNQIISNTSDGIYVCDTDLRYIHWNPSMEKISGYKAEKVLGKSVMELFPHVEEEKLNLLYKKALKGQFVKTGDYSFEIPDTGKTGWAQSFYSPVRNSDGEITGILGTVVDITERKQAEEKLKESDATLKKLSKQIPGVIYQFQQFPDGSSCFPFSSDGIRDIYEVHPESVKQDASPVIERIHPDDLDSVISSINKSYQTLENWELDYRVNLPEKGVRWLRGRARPEKMEDNSVVWHGYIADVTDQVKILEDNIQLKKQFQGVLDTMPNQVFVKDANGRILLANRASANYYDTIPENLIGKTDEDFGVCKKESEKYIESTRKVIETGEPHFIKEGLTVNKNGEEQWHQAIKVPFQLQHSGTITPAVLIVVTDISQRKKKEIELSETIGIAGDQNKRLLNFAHIVSHNLRNHAGNISMLLSLYDAEESNEEKEELLGYLKTASERLTETIQDLNEIVAAQTKVDKNLKELNIKKYLDKIKEILTTEIIAQNVKISENIPEDLTIEYNPAYLESILLNLLSNAIKYRHPERQPDIEIDAFADGDHVIFKITDNGTGIDLEKHRDKLFGMYNTFHENENAKGIGLFITKNQVESMGGKIEVESEVNKGTTFKLTLS
ncbi:MAG TPA: PAS domain S-box protein [Balneolaceae bacterium]|nr:PAS domain S-box protein [Balneolaceae bacterium]